MSWGYETRRGENAPNARLTNEQAHEARERRLREKLTYEQLAEAYHCSEPTIRRAVKRQTYRAEKE